MHAVLAVICNQGRAPLSTRPLAPPTSFAAAAGRPQMGHAAAECVVRAGLTLVPYTLTGYSAGVAVSNIGVAGIPVEVVGKERRQAAMAAIKQQHPNLIVVDYTTPYTVNGEPPAPPPAGRGIANDSTSSSRSGVRSGQRRPAV